VAPIAKAGLKQIAAVYRIEAQARGAEAQKASSPENAAHSTRWMKIMEAG
jgi:hypothetical protein